MTNNDDIYLAQLTRQYKLDEDSWVLCSLIINSTENCAWQLDFSYHFFF